MRLRQTLMWLLLLGAFGGLVFAQSFSVSFIDEWGAQATEVLENGRARLRVVDPAADLTTDLDPVTVELSATLSGHAVTATLTETGTQTGVFEGEAGLTTAFGEPDLLFTQPYSWNNVRDTASATYKGATDVAEVAGALIDFLLDGRPVQKIAVGESFTLRISDFSANRTSSGRERLRTTVQSSAGSLALDLVETGPSTSIFEGTVRTAFWNLAGPGDLGVVGAEDLQVTHTDRYSVQISRSFPVEERVVRFVDSTGRAVPEVLDYDRAIVRVMDHFANLDPLLRESFPVTTSAQRSGDTETITVREIGPNRGIFEGTVRVGSSSYSPFPENGQLETHPLAPDQSDTIHAACTSANQISTATALAVGSQLEILDQEGSAADSFAFGETVRVRVRSMSLNGGPVTIRSFPTGDVETVNLLLVDPERLLFEGSFVIQSGGPYPPGGYLSVNAGDTIEVEVADSNGITSSRAVTRAAAASVRFVDEEGNPTSVLLDGDLARLRVRDHWRSSTSQVSVDLSDLFSGDDETALLNQTSVDSPLFEGSIQLATDDTPSQDGRLTTYRSYGLPAHPDIVTGLYETLSSGTVKVRAETATAHFSFVDEQGNETVSLPAGAPLRLRLRYPALEASAEIPDQLAVTVEAVKSGDTEQFLLVETGPDTKIFEIALSPNIGFASPYDGTVQTLADDTVTAEHLFNWSLHLRTAARVLPLVLEFTDATGAPVDSYAIHQRIHVRAFDILANTSPAAPDLLSAEIQAHRPTDGASDLETVSLTETGPNTGVFTGWIDMRRAYSATEQDGLLQLAMNGPPYLEEQTLEVRRNGVQDRAGLRDSITQIVDDQGEDTDTVVIEHPIHIRVFRPLSDSSGSIDQLHVHVHGFGSGDDEQVLLQETGDSTGVFEGTIPTVPGEIAQHYSGALQAMPDDLVQVRVNGSPLGAASLDHVTVINNLPVAEDDTATTLENTAMVIPVLDNDNDPDGHTIRVGGWGPVTDAGGQAALNPDGTMLYTPPAGFVGTDRFSYHILDNYGGSDGAFVYVTVQRGDTAPDAVDDTATTAEDTAVTIFILSNDMDLSGGFPILTDVTPGAHGSISINGDSTITYTPFANFFGTDSLVYTIADGDGDLDSATVSITVTGVNDAPDAVNDSVSILEDTPVTIDVRANDSDPENDQLSVVTTSQPVFGTLATNADGTLTYTPAANYSGSASFTYTVADGNGGSDTATVTIDISSVNDAPNAVNDSASTPEDAVLGVNVLANDSDPESQSLTVSAVTQGAHGSVAVSLGVNVVYTPAPNYFGPDSFTYTIADGNGGSDTATVSINVTALNDSPDAVNDSGSTLEDAPVTLDVRTNDSDPEDNPLSLYLVTQGAHGSVVINGGGTITYTPAANYNGPDAFTYTIIDGSGAFDSATVSITVTAANDAPDAMNDTGATREGVSVLIPVLGNDTDIEGQALSVLSYSTPPNGALLRQAGDALRYTPNPNFNGTDSFTYTVSDGNGGTDTATVTVTVRDSLERVAILGTNSVWLQSGSDVLSGDVVVNANAAGPFLNGGTEISIGGNVTTPVAWDVQADQVTIAAGATVASDLFYNQLTNSGTVSGAQQTPLSLPIFTTLPAVPAATPGSTDVNVGTNGTRTLAAGSYRDLIVGRKGVVTFTGGIYHFRSIRIDREAKIWFSAAAEVRVQQKLSTRQTTSMAPATGAPINEADVIFYVAGINGTGGGLAETPKAVEIGVDNVLNANVYSPNGTLWLGDRTRARGSLFGHDVQVGIDAQVELRSYHRNQ